LLARVRVCRVGDQLGDLSVGGVRLGVSDAQGVLALEQILDGERRDAHEQTVNQSIGLGGAE
jgi:hypothetical protein